MRSSSLAPAANEHTSPTLRGRWLFTARTLWIAIALLAMGLYIAALPYDHQELQRVCAGGDDCRVDVQLTPPDAQALDDMGLSIGFYAIFYLSIETIILAVFGVVSGVIFWRRSSDPMALFLSLTLLLTGLTLPAIMEQVEERVPALELVIDFLNHLSPAAFAVLLLVFPDGRFVPRWTRFLAVAVTLLALVSFAVFIAPQGGGVPPGGNPLDDGLNRIIFLALPVGVFAQTYRYFRVADTVTRQQVKWVVFALAALVVGVIGGLSVASLTEPGRSQVLFYLIGVPLLFGLPYLMVPVALPFSILRYRLWDIDVVVNRALVYGVLTATLAGTYVGSVVLLQMALGGATGQSSDLAIVISTLVIAALFIPVRRRVQGTIDRRFFRRTYDATRTLAAFSARMRDEVDVERLTSELVTVVEDTMQPAHVSLWLRSPRGTASGGHAD